MTRFVYKTARYTGEQGYIISVIIFNCVGAMMSANIINMLLGRPYTH